MSYTAILQAAFGLFRCAKLADGTSLLISAAHLDCDPEEPRFSSARIAAWVSLAVWGLGLPLFLHQLVKRKHNTPGFQFSMIAYGYKPRYSHWEALECGKRFVTLLIITVTIHTRSTEEGAIFLVFVLHCWMAYATHCHPFCNNWVNAAYLYADMLLTAVLLVGLMNTWAPNGTATAVSSAVVLAGFCGMFLITSLLLPMELAATTDIGKKHCYALRSAWERLAVDDLAHDSALHGVRVTGRLLVAAARRRTSELLGLSEIGLNSVVRLSTTSNTRPTSKCFKLCVPES
jgi:hypothetical protein